MDHTFPRILSQSSLQGLASTSHADGARVGTHPCPTSTSVEIGVLGPKTITASFKRRASKKRGELRRKALAKAIAALPATPVVQSVQPTVATICTVTTALPVQVVAPTLIDRAVSQLGEDIQRLTVKTREVLARMNVSSAMTPPSTPAVVTTPVQTASEPVLV